MPDRPGVLGAVGTRIGAVKGDLVGIEILEHGDGSAVDELVVTLPEAGLVDLMVREINEIEGVGVESVHPLDSADHDPQLDAFLTAEVLVRADSEPAVAAALCEHVASTVGASWTTLIASGGEVLAAHGTGPKAEWLHAFISGGRAAEIETSTAPPLQGSDTLMTTLASIDAVFLLGRSDGPFRARERRRAEALARIADARLGNLRDLAVGVTPS